MRRDDGGWGVALRLAAPYLAVLLCWCGVRSGWLAILAYHAQILFWLTREPGGWHGTRDGWRFVGWAVPAALAGPALYFLLPHMTRVDVSLWLAEHRLWGWRFAAMIPYFGLVHPWLEQRHWAPLRERTRWAHPLFAGYHLIVLASLLMPVWLGVCFVVLTGTSYLWQRATRRFGGLAVPAVSHALADLGIVVAAWWRG